MNNMRVETPSVARASRTQTDFGLLAREHNLQTPSAVPFRRRAPSRRASTWRARDVAVLHAESRGDQDGVVDRLVGGAICSRVFDIAGCHVSSALLNFGGNRQQRLELRGNIRRLKVLLFVASGANLRGLRAAAQSSEWTSEAD